MAQRNKKFEHIIGKYNPGILIFLFRCAITTNFAMAFGVSKWPVPAPSLCWGVKVARPCTIRRDFWSSVQLRIGYDILRQARGNPWTGRGDIGRETWHQFLASLK
jgi:hypothetical protein